MCQSIALNGITQGGHHVILTQNVLEGPGAVFAGEDLVTHRLGENVGRNGGLSGLQFAELPGAAG